MALANPPLQVDVFYSMRSPYSYIALDRLLDIRQRFDVDMRLHVIWPIAIRDPESFTKMAAMGYRLPYQDIDIFRCADQYGVPFQYPVPDPVMQEEGKDGTRYGRILPFEEQTHIKVLTRCAAYANLKGKGWEYVNEVSRLVWNGQKKPWSADNYKFVKAAMNCIGLDGDAAFKTVMDDEPSKYDAIVEESVRLQKQNDAGHTGVPLMVFRGEPFFGQDRIDHLISRLRQYRVRERSWSRL